MDIGACFFVLLQILKRIKQYLANRTIGATRITRMPRYLTFGTYGRTGDEVGLDVGDVSTTKKIRK